MSLPEVEERITITNIIDLCNQSFFTKDGIDLLRDKNVIYLDKKDINLYFGASELIFIITDSLAEDKINAIKDVRAKTEALIITFCIGTFEDAEKESIEAVSKAIVIDESETGNCIRFIAKINSLLNEPATINFDYEDLISAFRGKHHCWRVLDDLSSDDIKNSLEKELIGKNWVKVLSDNPGCIMLLIISGDVSLTDVAYIAEIFTNDYYSDAIFAVDYDDSNKGKVSLFAVGSY